MSSNRKEPWGVLTPKGAGGIVTKSKRDLGSIAERYGVHYTTIAKLLEDLEDASYH